MSDFTAQCMYDVPVCWFCSWLYIGLWSKAFAGSLRPFVKDLSRSFHWCLWISSTLKRFFQMTYLFYHHFNCVTVSHWWVSCALSILVMSFIHFIIWMVFCEVFYHKNSVIVLSVNQWFMCILDYLCAAGQTWHQFVIVNCVTVGWAVLRLPNGIVGYAVLDGNLSTRSRLHTRFTACPFSVRHSEQLQCCRAKPIYPIRYWITAVANWWSVLSLLIVISRHSLAVVSFWLNSRIVRSSFFPLLLIISCSRHIDTASPDCTLSLHQLML